MMMKNFGKQRSTVKPESKVIDEFSVWIHSNIREVIEYVGTDNEFIGFEFDMVRYDKDEYIKIQADKYEALEVQITDTQLALCEIYESIGV
jgi:hypothetical protein